MIHLDKAQDLISTWLGRATLVLVFATIILSFMGFELSSGLIYTNLAFVLGFFAFYTLTEGLGFYVLRRLGQSIFVLWAIATIIFGLLRVIPGGPFDEEKTLAPEVKAAIEAKYRLNEPIYVQYADYMGNLVSGNLGYSYKYVGREVTEILAESYPASFQLGIFSLVLSILVGIPAGVFAASKHNSWKDNLTMILAITNVSVPSFLVAAIVITVFCFWLNVLPVALWEGPEYYILPVIVLGLRPAAAIARLTRSSVLDVIRSDYVRTAKAKGLSENAILYKHVLKNSLIPVLAYLGPLAAAILSGTFVIEHIFSIPGMAKHLIQSVTNRDYPLVLAVSLIFSVLLILSNLIVDILYTYFDPRIKLS